MSFDIGTPGGTRIGVAEHLKGIPPLYPPPPPPSTPSHPHIMPSHNLLIALTPHTLSFSHPHTLTSTQQMVAKYDYEPSEHSPNVNPEMELAFKAGDHITIYGNMVSQRFRQDQKHTP